MPSATTTRSCWPPARCSASADAEGSLDEIAKRAGVGPGTLYRHFPTRDALIDAVMRDWSDRINAPSEEIAL